MDLSWYVSRFMFGVWLVMCVIIGALYKGNLMSMLVSPRVPIPFTNYRELLQTGYPFVYASGSVFGEAIRVSQWISLIPVIEVPVYYWKLRYIIPICLIQSKVQTGVWNSDRHGICYVKPICLLSLLLHSFDIFRVLFYTNDWNMFKTIHLHE